MAVRERWEKHAPVARPGQVTPGALWFLRRVVYPVVRVLSRPSLEGVAHLPPPGKPFLLVGNHPSSLGMFEFLSFIAMYARAFPESEAPPPLAGFILAASFTWWPLSWIAPAVGAIPSTYTAAEDALAKGVPVCMFPGGDREAFRPFWRQDSANFAGRKGFLRIAQKAGVPIVPMGIRGVSTPILFSSQTLAYLAVWPRVAGLKRWAIGVLGVIVAALILWFVPLAWHWRVLITWAWLASPLAIASWVPVTLKIRIGRPLSPESLFGNRDEADETELASALRAVESVITELIRS